MYARQVYKQQQMRIGYDASIQTRSVILLSIGSPTADTEPAIDVDILRVSRTTRSDKESYLDYRIYSSFTKIPSPPRWR